MKEYDLVEVAKKEEGKANIDQSYFEVQNSDRFVSAVQGHRYRA
jgi:hypothetical protein